MDKKDFARLLIKYVSYNNEFNKGMPRNSAQAEIEEFLVCFADWIMSNEPYPTAPRLPGGEDV